MSASFRAFSISGLALFLSIGLIELKLFSVFSLMEVPLFSIIQSRMIPFHTSGGNHSLINVGSSLYMTKGFKAILSLVGILPFTKALLRASS